MLVNTSTEFQDDGRLVQVALQALAQEPVTVVATLPTGDPAGLRIPANAHVERARRIAAAYAATGGARTAADAFETRLLRAAAKLA